MTRTAERLTRAEKAERRRAARPRIVGVYAIVSGNRHYVGSSRHARKRWNHHRFLLRRGIHNSRALQEAWSERGGDGFEFVVLENVTDPALLLEREQWWIEHLCAATTGFNVAPFAGSGRGLTHGPEAREAIARAKRGQTLSPETKAKISATNTGNKNRAKITVAMVREIDRCLAAGMTRVAIAGQQGVSPGTINRLAKGVGWRPNQ